MCITNRRISKKYKSTCAQTVLITCVHNTSLVFFFFLWPTCMVVEIMQQLMISTYLYILAVHYSTSSISICHQFITFITWIQCNRSKHSAIHYLQTLTPSLNSGIGLLILDCWKMVELVYSLYVEWNVHCTSRN